MTGARPPRPRAAHRLIVFTVDAGYCDDPGGRRLVGDAIAQTIARVDAAPGGDDHGFAAVVYGSDLVRVIPVGTPPPWDLWVACPTAARPDGATVALADLAEQFLAHSPDGLPGAVDVLALVSPGAHVVCPDDLRVLLSAVDEPTDLADEWWARLAELRSRRRHTVLLR
ncbi:hypothetical protein AB0C12_21995 [Actinoplanes sp. NPDC048967]|uniref:hypothetical protein n=1 Tax=Actinoplanes sp. NPDC048967 TaxID=3155269 RepID=UPI0033D03C18